MTVFVSPVFSWIQICARLNIYKKRKQNQFGWFLGRFCCKTRINIQQNLPNSSPQGIRKKWWIRRSDELCKQVKTLSYKLVYFIIVTRIHRALICSTIQVYAVMVEYNNYFFNSIWTPPFDQAPFESLINLSAFSQWGVGSRFKPRV